MEAHLKSLLEELTLGADPFENAIKHNSSKEAWADLEHVDAQLAALENTITEHKSSNKIFETEGAFQTYARTLSRPLSHVRDVLEARQVYFVEAIKFASSAANSREAAPRQPSQHPWAQFLLHGCPQISRLPQGFPKAQKSLQGIPPAGVDLLMARFNDEGAAQWRFKPVSDTKDSIILSFGQEKDLILTKKDFFNEARSPTDKLSDDSCDKVCALSLLSG